MDKNMINIDELVRQRLGGGEEREMPGSWLRMRELLDKEMPDKKRVVGYYNWRRMLGIMSGLALISVLTVGGYNIFTATRVNTDSEKVIAAANPGTSMSPRTTSTTAQPVSGSLDGSAAPNSLASTKKIPQGVAKAKPATSARGNINGAEKAATQKDVVSDVNASKAEKSKNEINRTLSGTAKTPQVTEHKIAQSAPGKTLLAGSGVSASNGMQKTTLSSLQQDGTTPVIPTAQAGETAAVSPVLASNAANPTSNKNQELQTIEELNTASSPDNTRSVVPAPQPNQLMDSMNKMTVVHRLTINPISRVSSLKADTIGIERLAIPSSVQTEAVRQASATEPPAINPAVVAADAAAPSALVPLSSMKVESRKTSKWNARSFDEVVRDVKFNLAQTKFYPGVSAGGNSYMMGPNNMGGFQLGVFGLFTFGETWNIMAELKYLHRFNGGSTLRDNYVDLRPAPQGGYLQANIEHFFKFTSLQSIEMPLALRYAAGRLNVFGGINLAYHFAVNAEEVTLNAPDTAYKFQGSGQIKGGPTVVYHDFRARFALGGLAGISYEISPSIQVDLRATKNVWDNGYGIGAEQVSRQLYNAPSMQFSIFYRFSQKNQIPRAR